MGEFLEGPPPLLSEAEAAELTRNKAAAQLLAAYSIRAHNDFQKIYYDELSRLPNYRALESAVADLEAMFDELDEGDWKWFDHEVNRVGVAYIDLNRFKAVNDRFGHKTGDEVIVAIAALLDTALRREGDMAFRSHKAGDEFVVLLPYHSPVEHGDMLDSIETPYEQVLQPFLDTLEALHWVVEDELTSEQWMGMIGAAIGWQVYDPLLRGENPDHESLNKAIEIAEQKMREHKAHHRR